MLALTRRVGEEIVLGDPKQPLGVIRIVEIHGDKVRLSFDFPRQMQINRKELAELKAKQNGDGPPAPPAPPAAPSAAPASPAAAPKSSPPPKPTEQ